MQNFGHWTLTTLFPSLVLACSMFLPFTAMSTSGSFIFTGTTFWWWWWLLTGNTWLGHVTRTLRHVAAVLSSTLVVFSYQQVSIVQNVILQLNTSCTAGTSILYYMLTSSSTLASLCCSLPVTSYNIVFVVYHLINCCNMTSLPFS